MFYLCLVMVLLIMDADESC
uniref:Uncharacterized protein n=1 Tax=Arundo donax TaxID=35708 RepID=A0A0A9A9D1_ARUDO